MLAHIEASRYDVLVSGDLATAGRLRYELLGFPVDMPVPSPEWSVFVGRCEDIIATETGSWAAGFREKGA